LKSSADASVWGSGSKINFLMTGGVLNMVFEKVRTILVEQLDVHEDAVNMEASIVDDLEADSLDVVDIVMSLEEEFDVEVSDDDIEGLKTVGDIVKYIEAKVD